jgi:hypothetical protein
MDSETKKNGLAVAAHIAAASNPSWGSSVNNASRRKCLKDQRKESLRGLALATIQGLENQSNIAHDFIYR